MASDITVADGGTDDCNGLYTDTGSPHNGKTAWSYEGAVTWYISWHLGLHWVIHTALAAAPPAYTEHTYYSGAGTNPWDDAWSVGSGSADAPTVEEAGAVTYNITIQAQDEADNPLEVSIAFSPSPDNGADTTPSTTEFGLNYDDATEVTLVAPASDPEGYLWVDWVIDGENVSYEKTYVFEVTADVTVEAHYAPEYDLTVQTTDQNGAALSPGVSIAFSPSPDDAGNASPRTTEFVAGYAFRTVTLTAPATDPSGYRWVGWYQQGLLQEAAKEWAFSLTKARTCVAMYTTGRRNIGPPGQARRNSDDTAEKVGAN